MRASLWLFPLMVLLSGCEEPAHSACGAREGAPFQVIPGVDILEQLRAIPEVSGLEERTSRDSSRRLFVMQFAQPLDHCSVGDGSITQTVTLLYKDSAAPVVFATNGYGINRNPLLSEPAGLLDANQLTVEHRFFGSARPAPTPWEYLNIRAAANDHHRIAAAFHRVLPGPWVNWGASKGGMTALFHRYFYPDDVDATLAYVAPVMFGLNDPRYVTHLENVGEASCRDALKAMQRAVLIRKAEFEPALVSYGAAHQYSFNVLGVEKTLKFAVVETSFAFWQYGTAALCPSIPGPDAPTEDILSLMDTIGVLEFFDDAALDYFAAFFYQSATELGGTAYPQEHLLDLNGGVPIPDHVEAYPPYVEKRFSEEPMRLVELWSREAGTKVLYVYGQNDPWSAGAFEENPANDTHRFFVPGGNHGSNITKLPEPDHTAALTLLRGWLGLPPPPPVGPVRPVVAPAEESEPRSRL